MIEFIRRCQRQHLSEKGQGLVEYALILVLVAVVVIVILSLLGPQIGDIFGRINCEVMYRSKYSVDLQWYQVWDEGSFQRMLESVGAPPGAYNPSQNGCWGMIPNDPGNAANVHCNEQGICTY